MNDQIIIGILEEIKNLRIEMREGFKRLEEKNQILGQKIEKLEKGQQVLEQKVKIIDDRTVNIENKVINIEELRKRDITTINDILFSYEQGTQKMINEELNKRLS